MSGPLPQSIVRAVRAELWRRGMLREELDPTQQEIYDAIHGSPRMQFVLEAARKLGKSYLLGALALEACINNPGQRVNWCLPTGKQAVETAVPILRELSKKAPPECRGEYNGQSGHWTLPNAAYVVLFGAKDEKDADRGRGPQAVMSLVDEGAFFPSAMLPYVQRSVLMPQHLRTGGRIILASTPPVSMGHSWVRIAANARLGGAYAHRTVWQNGSMKPEAIRHMLSETAAAAGLTLEQYMLTAEYRREYMAETIVDETRAVVPEFAPNEEAIVGEFELPAHFDAYTGTDIGYAVHASAVVYAVADFEEQRLLVVDESWLERANTRQLAEEMLRQEKVYWPHLLAGNRARDNGNREQVFRTIDDTGRIVADLWDQHQLSTAPAEKADRDHNLALLRNLCLAQRLRIHPRCKRLIRQLRTATWNATGKQMEESVEDLHFDLVPALYQAVRDYWGLRHRNPFPPLVAGPGQRLRNQGPQVNQFAKALLGGTLAGRRLKRGR